MIVQIRTRETTVWMVSMEVNYVRAWTVNHNKVPMVEEIQWRSIAPKTVWRWE